MSVLNLNSISTEIKATAALKTCDLCIEILEDDVVVGRMVEIIKERANNIIKAAIPRNFADLTVQIREMDVYRDKIYKSIYKTIDANTQFTPHENLSEKLATIFHHLSKDKLRFLSENYLKQSTKLQEKIDFLLAETQKPVMETLGLIPNINKLIDVNIRFHELFDKRVDKKNEKPLPMHKLGGSLNSILHSLRVYIDTEHGEDTFMKCFKPLIEQNINYTKKPVEDIN
jgi:Family of unknown function (DUF6261)